MEHLFYEPGKSVLDDRVRYAFHSTPLQHDWSDDLEGLRISPETEWLGFDHDDRAGIPQSSVSPKFEEYPTIRGYDFSQVWQTGDPRSAHRSLRNAQLSEEAVSTRVAATLQSWLTFGWLEAIMKKEIKTSYLVRRVNDGKSYLTTQNLLFAILAWLKTMNESDVASSTIASQEVGEMLNTVAGVMQRLLFWVDSTDGPGTWKTEHPCLYDHLIMFMPSTVRLVNTFCLASLHVTERTGALGAFHIMLSGFVPAMNIRNRRLIDRGWCPALIRKFRYMFSTSCLDWLDVSGSTSPIGGHENCSDLECVRNNIDPSTYAMRHQSDGCDCSLVKPSEDQVLLAIDNGNIPTIAMSGCGDNVTLDVVPCSISTVGEYVAISHVWVDGLGSTTENGIPRCQALRINKLAQTALGRQEATWWIDSVCIPAAEKQRKKAIAILRSTYLNAAIVVVIDRCIRQCSMHTSSGTLRSEAILWAIVSSAWMQRLWTYQESYLAGGLIFEFSDGFWEYTEALPQPSLPKSVSPLWSCLASVVRTLRPRQSTDQVDGINLGALAYAVNWRTTSRISDELLAVAAVMNIDPTKMMARDGEDRIREFYLSVKSLPCDILLHASPKMTLPNFHWAPSTLMAKSKVNIDDAANAHNLVCTSDGLKGVFQGLVFSRSVEWQSNAEWASTSLLVGTSVYHLESEYPYQHITAFDIILLDSLPFSQKDAAPRTAGAAVLRCADDDIGAKVEYVGRVMVSRLLQESFLDNHSGPPTVEAVWEEKEFCVL